VRRLAPGVALALAFAACGGRERAKTDDRPTIGIRDATGVEVRVPQPVRRIVTTVPGLTETVIALGLRDSLVAVSEADTGISEVAGLPRLRVFPGIQVEALSSYAPDLVLVDPTFSPRDLQPLRARSRCSRPTRGASPDSARRFLRLGEALARPAEASGSSTISRTRESMRDRGSCSRSDGIAHPAPRVLLLAQAEPVIVLGPGSLLDDLIRACGSENVAADLGQPSGAMSSERIRERAPD